MHQYSIALCQNVAGSFIACVAMTSDYKFMCTEALISYEYKIIRV